MTISKKIMTDGKMFHDFVHVKNVYSNIKTLLKYEKGDEMVLLTAALLHDIKRDHINHGTEGAIYAKEILNSIDGLSEEFIDNVYEIIFSHDKVGFQDTQDKKIFYDADKMDAFNDLGLIRSFMMYASDNLTMEESCTRFLAYIDSTYSSLFTNISKELVHDAYLKNKIRVSTMILNYENSQL